MLEKLQSSAVAVTIALAILGYIVTYANNVRLERRKARLQRLNDQLQFLYGPLFSLTRANHRAWTTFRSRCRPGGSFFHRKPAPTPEELAEWRLWVCEVFMPINLRMEAAISQNAHLIEGTEIPGEFLDLVAHVAGYKTVIRNGPMESSRIIRPTSTSLARLIATWGRHLPI